MARGCCHKLRKNLKYKLQRLNRHATETPEWLANMSIVSSIDLASHKYKLKPDVTIHLRLHQDLVDDLIF